MGDFWKDATKLITCLADVCPSFGACQNFLSLCAFILCVRLTQHSNLTARFRSKPGLFHSLQAQIISKLFHMSAAVNTHGDNSKYQKFDWASIAALSTTSWNVQKYLNNTTYLFPKKRSLMPCRLLKKIKIFFCVIIYMKLH